MALSTLTCTSSQVYVRIVKQNGASWASEESHKIYAGSTAVVTSPTYANSELKENEYCISSTTNNQYTLELIDSYGDSWYTGSYVTIYGLYGNAIFKNYLTASLTETYALSLYYPIQMNSDWKATDGTVADGWTAYSFSDSSWTTVYLGTTATAFTGTQYFRKTFTGVANMAAYELALNYRYGIIAYINGEEVYRDNMPVGSVTSSTVATGSYTTISYHRFIRPGMEVEATQSVLAIEIHFLTTSSTVYVDFDAWMALYAPSALDTDCYIYSGDVTITSTTGSSPTNLFDFAKSTYFYLYSSTLPSTVTYSFTDADPYLTGVRVFPYSSPTSAPNNLVLQGSESGSTWTNVISVDGYTYTSSVYGVHRGYFSASNYKNYRLTISGSSTTYVYAYEVQPLICHYKRPASIEFAETSYSFYALYQEVSIAPTLGEWTSCTISPTLPEGVSLDANSCTISGKATSSSNLIQYTVTANMEGVNYSGSFSLQITECAGVVVTLLRSYKSNAIYEYYDFTDSTTQQVVYSIGYNSGQTNNVDVSTILCLTGTKYTVTTYCNLNYWYLNSYLYVNAMLAGDEYETVRAIRFDNYLGLPTTFSLNLDFSIKSYSTWYYKMGTVPDSWTGSDTSGWDSGSRVSFPASTNQIQLYKKTFSVSSLNNVAGFVISLRYKYGCVIYLNGVEVFRNGVDGTLSSSSTATTMYTDVLYHQISLPVKTIAIDSNPSVSYLIQGSNTIAVALVAISSTQTTSDFDCAVRLMGDSSVSRVFDYSYASSYISGYPAYIFSSYYVYYIYYSSCTSNYITITFNNDRREWISSVVLQLYYTQTTQYPRRFNLYGRNSNSDTWVSLKTVTGMTWSMAGQEKKIYIENNVPYNQYRFENFGTAVTSGTSDECYWRVGRLDMFSDDMGVTVPELSYESQMSIYMNVEMAEVYPNSSYYTDFEITPDLPSGVTIDSQTGMISGTATTTTTVATTYSVTARKITGGSSSATFSLSVGICSGDRSLITLVARTDTNNRQASYKLYQGTSASGTVVSSNEYFRAASSLNYADFCVPHNIYTLQLLDSAGNGWSNPAGYYLSVDLGEMRFEMGQLASTVSSVTTLFSSYLPFQIEYDDWKLYNDVYTVSEDWNQASFDDSTWQTVKAMNIGSSESVTMYLRRAVTIPDISYYQVLNVRVKYNGGVAAYFNSRLVARFNLEENFDSSSTSLEIHDSTVFSQFHVILATAGGVTGNNVMAFELHRPVGMSSSTTFTFDATGVFGVNDCSPVLDTFSTLEGTTPSVVSSLDSLFDMSPVTYGYQSNSVGTYIAWTVENLEGSKFNSFAMQTVYARTSWGFSVYGRMNTEDDYTSMLALTGQATVALGRKAWDIPVGIASFKEFRFEVDVAASSTVYVSSYITQYCKATGDICEGVDDFPPVANGQISPSVCSEGYRGYTYRECVNGVFSDIKTDKCVYKEPAKLSYPSQRYVFIRDVAAATDLPTYLNIIEEFYLSEGTFLPEGLALDTKTGQITGTPTDVADLAAYTIYGKNPAGVTYTAINIQIRIGECQADGVFPKTEVGEIAEYDCAMQGSYVGTQRRVCLLGTENGEWQKASGFCMPIFAIVVLIFVVILIIFFVAVLITRTSRTKSVGGVKGKSKKSGNKSSLKKAGSKSGVKTVKV